MQNYASDEKSRFPVEELMAVTNFAEPIFSTLWIGSRTRACGYTLIEVDNYHALQLLEYLYTGQVDCIYIDSPNKTGARDWKYNNNYVDSNDSKKHDLVGP